MGAMLLDKDDPVKVLLACDDVLLAPQESRCASGFIPGVVFPTSQSPLVMDVLRSIAARRIPSLASCSRRSTFCSTALKSIPRKRRVIVSKKTPQNLEIIWNCAIFIYALLDAE